MKGWEELNKIKALLSEDANVSRAARKLGMDRKTIRKYRDMKMDEIAQGKKKSKTRRKKLDSFKKLIKHRVEMMIEDGIINSKAVYDELKAEGYCGSERTVRRYIAGYRKIIRKSANISLLRLNRANRRWRTSVRSEKL